MASRARRTRGGGGSGLSGLTSGRPRPRGRPRPLRDPGRRRARSAGLRGPDPREDLSHPYPESPSQAASRASPRIPRPSGWPGSPASGPSRDPLPRSTSDSSLEGTPTDPPPPSPLEALSPLPPCARLVERPPLIFPRLLQTLSYASKIFLREPCSGPRSPILLLSLEIFPRGHSSYSNNMCQISSLGASLISPKNLQITDSPKSPPDPVHSRNLPRRPTSHIPTISPRLPSHTSQEFSLPSTPIPAIALEIFHSSPPNLRAPSPGLLQNAPDVPWKIFQRDPLKWPRILKTPLEPHPSPQFISHIHSFSIYTSQKSSLWALPQVPKVPKISSCSSNFPTLKCSIEHPHIPQKSSPETLLIYAKNLLQRFP